MAGLAGGGSSWEKEINECRCAAILLMMLQATLFGAGAQDAISHTRGGRSWTPGHACFPTHPPPGRGAGRPGFWGGLGRPARRLPQSSVLPMLGRQGRGSLSWGLVMSVAE